MGRRRASIAHPVWERIVALGGVFLAAAVLTAVADALPGSVGRVVGHPKKLGTRNLVFVSTSGDDSTCVRGDASRPCASFDRAYRIARQGDVVEVGAGVYPRQTIAFDSTKTTAAGSCRLVYDGAGTFASSRAGCVTFEPAPRARVQVGAATRTTANLNMKATTAIPVVSTAGFSPAFPVVLGRSTWSCSGKAATELLGCKPTGATYATQLDGWASGTDVVQGGVTVLGASFIDVMGMSLSTVGVNTDGSHMSRDVLFDGDRAEFGYWSGKNLYFENGTLGGYNGSQPNTFTRCHRCGVYETTVHDETLAACDGFLSGQRTKDFCHGDGVYASFSSNMYFVSDTFDGNDVFHLYFDHGNAVNPGPVTIADNYFGKMGPDGGYYAASIRGNTNDVLDGYTIERNASRLAWAIGAESGQRNVSLSDWLIAENTFGAPMCPTEPTGWTGSFDVRFVDNIGTVGCSSTEGLIASGNQTIRALGIAEGMSGLLTEALAHALRVSVWKPHR